MNTDDDWEFEVLKSSLQPKTDDYGVIINHPDTYEYLGKLLTARELAHFSWADELGTMFHCSFSWATHSNPWLHDYKGGIWVSIVNYKTYYFSPKQVDFHGSYVGQKLGIGSGVTADKFTELLNGVINSTTADQLEALLKITKMSEQK